MTPFLKAYAQGCGQPGRDWFHPLSGWFLVEMMRLEEARSGILAHATRAAPPWRNAVAAALSAGIRDKPDRFLLRANGFLDDAETDIQIGDALMAMSPRQILDAAFDEVPRGLAPILNKVGSSLLNTSETYARLYALTASNDPDNAARARVLERLEGCLDDELFQVVEVLDIQLLTPKTAMAVRTASEAHRFAESVPVIRRVCTTATDDALRQSIEDAAHFRVSSWRRSWLERADRLPLLGIALDDDPRVERIVPAQARAMGKVWRNCLAGHTQAMAAGASAYLAIADLNIVAVLTRVETGWLLTGLHGRGNFPVCAATKAAAATHLKSQGVICLMPVGSPLELRGPLDSFGDVDDLDFELDGLAL